MDRENRGQSLRLAYAAAFVLPWVITLFRFGIREYAGDKSHLVFYTLPVVIAATLGGLWPGLLASLIGLALGVYYILPPEFSFYIPDISSWIAVVGIASIWVLISILSNGLLVRRRQASVALAQTEASQNQLASVLNRITDGLVTYGSSGQITTANPAFAALVGSSPGKIIGQPLAEVLSPALLAGIHDALRESMATGRFEQHEVTDTTTEKTFTFRLFPDRDREEMALFVEDSTSRKQLEETQKALLMEERVRRSSAEEESRRKDEFVATLSHELRTPLTSIIGWTEILKTKPEAASLTDGMEAIEKAARQQAQLVEDLLDMSRIVTGQLKMHMEIIDLHEIAGDVLAAHEATARQQNKTLIGPDPEGQCFVRGDALRLIQIFSNLISNSLKYSENGATIRISFREVGETVEGAVQDDGIGIPSDQLDHVFDRFRQIPSAGSRRQAGLGLGLSIVDQLVQAHGGSVRAESDGRGCGSTVTVTLPRAHPKLAEED